jgi:hypothetical protein
MKLISLTSALAAVLGLALACAPVTASAQSTNAPSSSTSATTAPAAKKTQYKGQITAINASSVTVKGASATLTLAITSDTKFEFGTAKKNTPATAADFAANDNVTGSYTKNADGTMTAVTVRKKQPATK